ncbi:MAG: hypothetical protein RIS64_1383 [Bacteroidota bacterium]
MKKSFLATVAVVFSTIYAVSAQNVQEAPRRTTAEPQNTVNIKPIFAGGESYLRASQVTQGTVATQPSTQDKQVANEPKPTTVPQTTTKQ